MSVKVKKIKLVDTVMKIRKLENSHALLKYWNFESEITSEFLKRIGAKNFQ